MTTNLHQPDLRSGRSRQRASALLAVFWMLAILTFAIVTTLAIVLTDLKTESTRKQAFAARQLAEKGVAIAANPVVDRWDPILRHEDNFGDSFDVRIESEAVRVHLNAALIRGDRPELLSLFSGGWNLNPNEADSLLDAMLDWIDTDDLARNRGAERNHYAGAGFPSLPLNRPFHSLDEVAMVRGMKTAGARYPGWREDLTLWSLSGKLDLSEADARLISLVCECSSQAALSFVNTRNGSDGIPMTGDDSIVGSVSDAIQQLGLPLSAENLVSGRITIDEPAVRIQSLGQVGDFRLMREIVMQRSKSQPFLYHLNDRVLP